MSNCKNCATYDVCKMKSDKVENCGFYHQVRCEYCRNETPYEQQACIDGDYRFDGEDEYWEESINYENRYIDETDFKYCPYCGRELRSEHDE